MIDQVYDGDIYANPKIELMQACFHEALKMYNNTFSRWDDNTRTVIKETAHLLFKQATEI